MQRFLLLAALSFAGLANAAADPAHHSADGGGCPEAVQPAAEAAQPAAPTTALDAEVQPPGSAQHPQRRTLSNGERTRVPLRWHSFVPGMFM